jgi:hypothetical protein
VSDKSSSEAYYAGAYWGPRKESAEECAWRAADFFNLLAPADSFLAQWYKPARRRKDARKYPLMPPDLLSLTELFRRGVNREKGGPIFEDLGFTFWFDNGGPTRDCAALRIKCGDYSGGSNVRQYPEACLHTSSPRTHPGRTSCAAARPSPNGVCAPSSAPPPSRQRRGSPPPAPAPPLIEGAAILCSKWSCSIKGAVP